MQVARNEPAFHSSSVWFWNSSSFHDLYPHSSLQDNVALGILQDRGNTIYSTLTLLLQIERVCVLWPDYGIWSLPEHYTPHGWPQWKPGTASWIHANSYLKSGFAPTRFCFLLSSWGSGAPNVPNSIGSLTIWSALLLWAVLLWTPFDVQSSSEHDLNLLQELIPPQSLSTQLDTGLLGWCPAKLISPRVHAVTTGGRGWLSCPHQFHRDYIQPSELTLWLDDCHC